MEKIFEEAHKKILYCFTGEDGGVSFAKYIARMRIMAKNATNGDEAAIQIVELVNKFSRLIDALTK